MVIEELILSFLLINKKINQIINCRILLLLLLYYQYYHCYNHYKDFSSNKINRDDPDNQEELN